MCAGHRSLTCTLVLLLLSGVLCKDWDVQYESVCAVRGSSVVLPCAFSYPDKHVVKEVKWGRVRNEKIIYFHTIRSKKFEYIGDKIHNCSLKINQVAYNDTGRYVFRLITNIDKWTGQKGSHLNVVDLKILVTKPNTNRIKEGDSVNLTCDSCVGDKHLSIIWLRNGEPINEGPSLRFNDISHTNSGNYTCSLKTFKGATSAATNIDVEYGPKNTSGSVRPDLTGSNVTLTCSSSANPPVENYQWFKINDDDYITSAGNEPKLHFPLVVAGRYFCSATNKHGRQNSSIVTLSAPHGTLTGDVIVNITAATVSAVLILTVVVIIIIRFNKRNKREPEGEYVEGTQNTIYVNWPAVGSSHLHEGGQREAKPTEVVYTTLDFNNKRKSSSQQQVDSHNDDGVAIYSTVWS